MESDTDDIAEALTASVTQPDPRATPQSAIPDAQNLENRDISLRTRLDILAEVGERVLSPVQASSSSLPAENPHPGNSPTSSNSSGGTVDVREPESGNVLGQNQILAYDQEAGSELQESEPGNLPGDVQAAIARGKQLNFHDDPGILQIHLERENPEVDQVWKYINQKYTIGGIMSKRFCVVYLYPDAAERARILPDEEEVIGFAITSGENQKYPKVVESGLRVYLSGLEPEFIVGSCMVKFAKEGINKIKHYHIFVMVPQDLLVPKYRRSPVSRVPVSQWWRLVDANKIDMKRTFGVETYRGFTSKEYWEVVQRQLGDLRVNWGLKRVPAWMRHIPGLPDHIYQIRARPDTDTEAEHTEFEEGKRNSRQRKKVTRFDPEQERQKEIRRAKRARELEGILDVDPRPKRKRSAGGKGKKKKSVHFGAESGAESGFETEDPNPAEQSAVEDDPDTEYERAEENPRFSEFPPRHHPHSSFSTQQMGAESEARAVGNPTLHYPHAGAMQVDTLVGIIQKELETFSRNHKFQNLESRIINAISDKIVISSADAVEQVLNTAMQFRDRVFAIEEQLKRQSMALIGMSENIAEIKEGIKKPKYSLEETTELMGRIREEYGKMFERISGSTQTQPTPQAPAPQIPAGIPAALPAAPLPQQFPAMSGQQMPYGIQHYQFGHFPEQQHYGNPSPASRANPEFQFDQQPGRRGDRSRQGRGGRQGFHAPVGHRGAQDHSLEHQSDDESTQPPEPDDDTEQEMRAFRAWRRTQGKK